MFYFLAYLALFEVITALRTVYYLHTGKVQRHHRATTKHLREVLKGLNTGRRYKGAVILNDKYFEGIMAVTGGAFYNKMDNQVYIVDELMDRVSPKELDVILRHEKGHRHYRDRGISYCNVHRAMKEVRADLYAARHVGEEAVLNMLYNTYRTVFSGQSAQRKKTRSTEKLKLVGQIVDTFLFGFLPRFVALQVCRVFR